ncbi:MAG: hypothetical protein UV40_C0038G0009 [Parcubacteria group bacterium GW2011_GWA1_42_7]|nr:MAG: hypothetical protein UV34_C0016G0014 [Parcubacteria group bacterium GW2011_GWB1_42_6]KKS68967.1 MAG: hypothetical protein UV40_C0038G0009 [Parcubacteria group bacterium GW2011_GWA1_42_7]KKS91304.1 MAG: hypothetical protein UV67_C0032G0010 [Parcubacteria group bacterium GW2011_GWC1_43_12]
MKLDLKAIGKIKKIISKAPLEIFEKTPPLYILAPVALFFLIWGAILFYEYEIKSPEIPSQTGQAIFNKQLFNHVMWDMERRKTDLGEGVKKSYRDIFR